METGYLTITWSTSRGRDTYGYNLVKLDTGWRGKVYRTCGGGYDMTGTVVGDWLQNTYQDRLRAIGDNAAATFGKVQGYKSDNENRSKLYGMARNVDTGKVSLDGACGIRCMLDIAAAIGISLSATCNRKGHVTGYTMTDYGSADALKAAQQVRA